MGLFDFFKKKQPKLTEAEQKWDKMWDMWTADKADAPYRQLMTYQSEVNNGGHDQYFTNAANIGALQEELSVLNTILPDKLRDNLECAYRAYLVLEKEDDEAAEEILERCDDVFYDCEEEIINILHSYANTIEL